MTTFPSALIHRSTRIGWDGLWDEAQHRSISSPLGWKVLPAPTPCWDAPGEAKALQPPPWDGAAALGGPPGLLRRCITAMLRATGGCLLFGLSPKKVPSAALPREFFSLAGTRGRFAQQERGAGIQAARPHRNERWDSWDAPEHTAPCCQFLTSPDTKDLGEGNVQNTQITLKRRALPKRYFSFESRRLSH